MSATLPDSELGAAPEALAAPAVQPSVEQTVAPAAAAPAPSGAARGAIELEKTRAEEAEAEERKHGHLRR